MKVDCLGVDYSQSDLLSFVATECSGCEGRHLVLAGNSCKRTKKLHVVGALAFAFISNLKQIFNQGTVVLFLSVNV